MKIYNYHPLTGEYLGESLADADPLDVGNWLIPTNATDIVPKEVGENEVAIFVNGTWFVLNDFRGLVYYKEDGSKVEITDIGVAPEDDDDYFGIEPPPVSETPEQIIARLEGAIDRYLDAQAQSFRYESIRTMVTYENDPNPKFHAEGVGAKSFRSAVYTLGVSLISEVQSGLREVPTEAELLALMPKLEDFVTY